MKFYHVDAFTEEPFKGNPAVVIVTEEELPEKLMQNIAKEMNVSETAFVTKKSNTLNIRWFTPTVEVNLCGHATLASGHILWSEAIVSDSSIILESKSGELGITKEAGKYYLNFPARPGVEKQSYYEKVKAIIGVKPEYVCTNGHHCLAVVGSTDFIKEYSPEPSKILTLEENGLILAALDSTNKYDFIYRIFLPKIGILEDPVNGSSNILQVPYWCNRLGKNSLTAFQASERTGELFLSMKSDRVIIGGNAVTTTEGKIII